VEEFEVGGGVKRNERGIRVLVNYPDVPVTEKRCAWAESLASIIASAHSCEILVSVGSSRIWLVGRKSDVAVAEYLFITMERIAEKISTKEYKKFRSAMRALDNGGSAYLYRTHGFTASWLKGFITRLSQRLNEEKTKIDAEYNTGTSLMRINKEALAVRAYLDAKKNTKKAKAVKGQGGFNSEGYARGRAAADSLNLNANAVHAGSPNKQLN
jgi:hypothetical protein